jgi:hypothetical protein
VYEIGVDIGEQRAIRQQAQRDREAADERLYEPPVAVRRVQRTQPRHEPSLAARPL